MKCNKPNIVLYIILFFLVTSILSCQNKKKQEKEAYLKSVIENCLGKKLTIPDSLRIYAPFHDYLADSVLISSAKYKIYSHISASCPTCIRNIKLWNNIIPDFERFKVPVILICGSSDNFELFYYMHETGEINSFFYPFFFDIKNNFIKQNKFMKESPHFETVLTDKENNILLLGNPIHSKEMRDLYLKEIQKGIEQKK